MMGEGVLADRESSMIQEPARWASPIERVGEFLRAHDLPAIPAHYEVAYDYLVGNDPDLSRHVDEAIKEHGRLTPAIIAGILTVRAAAMSATELARAAAEAHEQLRRIVDIVDRSGRDVRDYGSALEQLSGRPAADAVESLIGVTRAMIEKTRCAEEDLRRAGEEMRQLRESLAEARHKADTDPLTGLPNRRALDARLRSAFEAARCDGTPLSIAICDIDRFKTVNDTHGHDVGDEVIKFIGAALGHGSERCFVARYGGEEFVMLFEGCTPDDAATQIDRIRAGIAARDFKVTATGRQLGTLTFSAGIAGISGRRGPQATLKIADAALYRAKQDGRNRVHVAR